MEMAGYYCFEYLFGYFSFALNSLENKESLVNGQIALFIISSWLDDAFGLVGWGSTI